MMAESYDKVLEFFSEHETAISTAEMDSEINVAKLFSDVKKA